MPDRTIVDAMTTIYGSPEEAPVPLPAGPTTESTSDTLPPQPADKTPLSPGVSIQP